MRYSEILNEDGINLYITSIKQLNTMFSYGEVKLLGGNLILDIKRLESITFPPNFIVYGNMYIGPWIHNLNGDVTIKGNLNLAESNLESWGGKLKVEGDMNVDIQVDDLKLPDNMIVGKDLNLESTWISTLPNNLTVGGDLNIAETNIYALPNSLKVGGEIYTSDDAYDNYRLTWDDEEDIN